MIKKLKNYVEDLFEGYSKTKKVKELKDELIANLIEKYNDLLAKGLSEKEAYETVIDGIGDISELVDNLEESNVLNPTYNQRYREKRAKYIAIAVMLYIVSVIPVISFSLLGEFASIMGVVIMFVIVALATGLIIYTGALKPKYFKENETLVEEFKEWKSHKNHHDVFEKSITSAIWTFVVAIYLIISFIFGIWAYSWIIFIIGAAINQIIKAIFDLRSDSK
jgi:uncharacterized membrane protein